MRVLLSSVRMVIPLIMPSLITDVFQEFCRFGPTVSVILPVGDGGVKNVFVFCSQSHADKLTPSSRLMMAVLAEAQIRCVGQPMLIIRIPTLILKSFLASPREKLLVGK